MLSSLSASSPARGADRKGSWAGQESSSLPGAVYLCALHSPQLFGSRGRQMLRAGSSRSSDSSQGQSCHCTARRGGRGSTNPPAGAATAAGLKAGWLPALSPRIHPGLPGAKIPWKWIRRSFAGLTFSTWRTALPALSGHGKP